MTPDETHSDVHAAEVCAFCQLPVPAGLFGNSSRHVSEPVYCCLGCRVAAAVANEGGDVGVSRWEMTRLGLGVFLSMQVMVVTMALWGYANDNSPASQTISDLLRYFGLILTTGVVLLLGMPLFENAVDSLRRCSRSTDPLLAIGVLAAFVASAVAVATGSGDVYFEVACVILVLVTLGRTLEARSRLKASAALDALAKLLPDTVRRWMPDSEASVPLNTIMAGDTVRVLAGERIPVDGRLRRGAGAIDEQTLTGESWPRNCNPGDRVLAGTLNLDSELFIAVETSPQASRFQKLLEAVRTARLSRGRYQRLADSASSWFLPVVAIVAVTSAGWHGFHTGPEAGLMTGLAVLLIACPCALGLATPLAVWSALGAAASRGALFRSGEALERLADVKAIRFDKTGTLTDGQPRFSDVVCAPGVSIQEVWQTAFRLANGSTHPVSRAIVAAATDHVPREELNTGSGEATIHRPGFGVFATDGNNIPVSALGSLRLMSDLEWRVPRDLAAAAIEAVQSARGMVAVGRNGLVTGLFLFDEALRPGAKALADWCRTSGLDAAVLTGDHTQRGRWLESELLLPVSAELLPDDKLAAIRTAQSTVGPVVMVGDGLNDAPSLVAADVGIALGCGTDVTRDAAGLCLLGNDLSQVSWSILLAKTTITAVKRNLAWAFGYNLIGVGIAAAGELNPVFAALLMAGSSSFVIVNSLRLASFKLPESTSAQKSEPSPTTHSVQQPRVAAGGIAC